MPAEEAAYDLILANLDRGTLLASARHLLRPVHAGVRLLVSGILLEDDKEIAATFLRHGGSVIPRSQREGWLALGVGLPDSCEG